jgi:hypothetical protein
MASLNNLATLRELPLNDIPIGLPQNFSPVQVICRELYKISDGSPRYRNIDRPTWVAEPRFTTIEEFAREVATRGYTRNPSPLPEPEENRWIDIKVSRDSYIVIELAPELAWNFTTLLDDSGDPVAGVTLLWLSDDHPDPLSHDGFLHYVDDSGVIHDRPAANCRVAYFAAKPMLNPMHGNKYEQRICYVVDWNGGTREFVDPDIRFPGNGSG